MLMTGQTGQTGVSRQETGALPALHLLAQLEYGTKTETGLPLLRGCCRGKTTSAESREGVAAPAFETRRRTGSHRPWAVDLESTQFSSHLDPSSRTENAVVGHAATAFAFRNAALRRKRLPAIGGGGTIYIETGPGNS